MGLVSESHVPPHATPLLAMVNTAGLLELNVTATEIGAPAEFFAETVKFCVPPTSTDAVAGVRVIDAGTLGAAGALLLLPQPARLPISKLRITTQRTEPHRPMHPPRSFIWSERVLFWKISV